MRFFLTILLLTTLLFSQVRVISPTKFEHNGIVKDFRGKDFIVVCLREKNSEGKIFYVNEWGEPVFQDVISSGAYGHRTPTGIFHVMWKKERHMSTKYPDPSGINNMDYSMFFTPQGHALHKGNVNAMSHGCIHVNTFTIQELFYNLDVGTPVVVIRGQYSLQFMDSLSLF